MTPVTQRWTDDRLDDLAQRAAKLDEDKADTKDLAAVVDELKGIKRLLTGLLVSIVLASVAFGFAALQVSGSHP